MSAISSEAEATNPSTDSMLSSSDLTTEGELRIQIHSCFLNVKVARPYVVITLGEQQQQTSVSEFRDGQWNESFKFVVTFHAQLFGTIQIDLFDNYTIYPDKHIGRAEIRIKTLENMPETFSSYYELWDKKLSTGASSSVGREKAAVNNVGALHATISYVDLKASNFIDLGLNLGEIKEKRTAPPGSTNLISEEQLSTEFKRHLRFQRERGKTNKRDAKSEKLGESKSIASVCVDYSDQWEDCNNDGYGDSDEENDIIKPLHSKGNKVELTANSSIDSDEEFGEMVTAPPPADITKNGIQPRQLPLRNNIRTIAEDDDPIDKKNSKTFLDTVGTWAGGAEASQVIRTIGKLLATFGQGFELTNMQVLTGLSVLEKFYSDLPRRRTQNVVEDLSNIDDAARFWKFSIASYGWKGLNFIGKGNGIFSDAMREHSDAKSIVEYLTIPKEDLLAYEFRSAEAFRPSYFIAKDRFSNSIVLSIRGTMSVMDTLTDLVCEYEPWRGGFIHSGMKNSALWFFHHVAPQLIAYSNEHAADGLIIVGHSLGASTAAILTIMLTDYMDKFRQGKDEEFRLQCYGYAPACGLSLDLAERHNDIIHSFVFADDIVSKLSYGTMMDVKELIIASSEAVRDMGLSEIWSGNSEGAKWKAAFERIAEVRKRILNSMENPRLYVAGEIYQFWVDPTPSNDTRIVVEKTTAKRVCDEAVIKKSIIIDHLPTNFDLAFRRARETIMLEGSRNTSFFKKENADFHHSAPSPILSDKEVLHVDNLADNDCHDEKDVLTSKNTKNATIWDVVTDQGLKGTTRRSGGDGNIVENQASR